jgi:hypothetical protein
MGQMTYAIMYGVKEDDCFRWCGEDGDGGILCAFRAHVAPMISALENKGAGYYGAKRRLIPCRSSADPIVWGFAVACAGSGIGGVPELRGLPFDANAVERKYPKAHARARRRWARFARFCKTRDFAISAARLWLVEKEVP